jgi:hypothetical protein
MNGHAILPLRSTLFLTAFVLLLAGVTAFSQTTDPNVLTGTWTGRLSSHNYESFPVTLVITKVGTGTLHGAIDHISRCLKDAMLLFTMNGSNVVFAGTDAEGDTVTLNGAVDSAGTTFSLNYIVNSSAIARCETDQGEGTLDKQYCLQSYS